MTAVTCAACDRAPDHFVLVPGAAPVRHLCTEHFRMLRRIKIKFAAARKKACARHE